MAAQPIALERLDSSSGAASCVRSVSSSCSFILEGMKVSTSNASVHVVVVGAGVFGAWTAHHLRARGRRGHAGRCVRPANPRASSGDQTRILRCGYGADEIYSQFARRSLDQWRALQERVERMPIWHPCGVLLLAAADDPTRSRRRQTLEQGGYALEVLDAVRAARTVSASRRRATSSMALLEPECGVLDGAPRRARAGRGARAIGCAVDPRQARRRRQCQVGFASMRLADGGEMHRRCLRVRVRSVAAVGASAVARTVSSGPTRQTVVYFGTPAW